MRAKDYIENYLEIKVPETTIIDGSWFKETCLPMVVSCQSCNMTMSLFSADIKPDGTTFCSECAPDDEEYDEGFLPPCEMNDYECEHMACPLFDECH